jgi:hypothetical protein
VGCDEETYGYGYLVGSTVKLRDATGLAVEIVREHEPSLVALRGYPDPQPDH